ncbi:DUF5017 domain-containing protein [Arcticibacter sp. MXS-1]|uniref:DUF5017 domain-containing protein n=1 Tax=Arcticibacter sp. MXS-1 TaxID=3341726 RepID=UPI0035A99FE6
MKRFYYLSIAAILLLSSSCRRDEVNVPDFDVRTDKQEYKVNELVEFVFKGTANSITFYSGESGQEYKYKDRLEFDNSVLKVNMVTQTLYGSQPNNLRLMVSTDFNGVYDIPSVKAATWVNISDRLTFGGATDTPSGDAIVSDLYQAGKPIYFAFRYVGEAAPAGATTTTQRLWRVKQFNVTNTFPNGLSSIITDRASAGWKAVDFENPSNSWTFSNSTMIFFLLIVHWLLRKTGLLQKRCFLTIRRVRIREPRSRDT